jgi:hypothetical protein
MAEFAFFLLFYSVPFLALFLLPRLSWLVIGAAVASLIVGGLFAVMQRSTGDAGIGAYLMFVIVALGSLRVESADWRCLRSARKDEDVRRPCWPPLCLTSPFPR